MNFQFINIISFRFNILYSYLKHMLMIPGNGNNVLQENNYKTILLI